MEAQGAALPLSVSSKGVSGDCNNWLEYSMRLSLRDPCPRHKRHGVGGMGGKFSRRRMIENVRGGWGKWNSPDEGILQGKPLNVPWHHGVKDTRAAWCQWGPGQGHREARTGLLSGFSSHRSSGQGLLGFLPAFSKVVTSTLIGLLVLKSQNSSVSQSRQPGFRSAPPTW